MVTLYSKQHLSKALLEAGLPFSIPSIRNYKRKGIIKEPENRVVFNDRVWLFYTGDEISANVEAVRKYLGK